MMYPPCPSILTLAVGKVLHVEDKEVATESILKSGAKELGDDEFGINGGFYTTAGALNATVAGLGKGALSANLIHPLAAIFLETRPPFFF